MISMLYQFYMNDTNVDYKPSHRLLHLYCIFMLVVTTFLIYAGGFTTSIEAGMAFLDWPLSNGSINPEGWTKDKDMAAEHSHRLLGMKLGTLCIILVVWTRIVSCSSRIKKLSIAVLAVVLFQGLLGGLRVVLDEQNIAVNNNFIAMSFAVAHACGAQIVVCLIASLVVSTTRRWSKTHLHSESGGIVVKLGIFSTILIFVQIFIGAAMRHGKAALAIPFFPYSTHDNQWLPEAWNWMVALNFAHRVGAILVTVALVYFFIKLWTSVDHRKLIGFFVYIPAFLLCVQIYLGALVIWTSENEHSATFHTITGAFLLCSCWAITYLSLKLKPEREKKKVVQIA